MKKLEQKEQKQKFIQTEEKDYTKLDVNKKNLEEYEELMEKSSYKYDSFFNSNSPTVRMILLSLLIFIIFGVVYYLISFLFFY